MYKSDLKYTNVFIYCTTAAALAIKNIIIETQNIWLCPGAMYPRYIKNDGAVVSAGTEC